MQYPYSELIKQILEDMPPIKKPMDAYEFDKHIHIVDIPVKETVIGSILGRRNILVFNYWALLFGTLDNSDVGGAISAGGISYTLRTSNSVPVGSIYIAIGSGTTPEAFTQYNLVSSIKSLTSTVTFGQLSDRNRITVTGVTDTAAEEVGLFQQLYDTSSNKHTTMLARKLIHVDAGKTINYYIDFLNPWTYNFALIMYGIHTYSDVSGVTDTSGAQFKARSSGDVNSGPVRLRGSSQAYQWTPSLVNISSDIEFATYRYLVNYRFTVFYFIIGIAVPSSSLQLNTLSLIQGIYDTSASSHDVYQMVLPLSSPITLYAYTTNIVFLRLVAM